MPPTLARKQLRYFSPLRAVLENADVLLFNYHDVTHEPTRIPTHATSLQAKGFRFSRGKYIFFTSKDQSYQSEQYPITTNLQSIQFRYNLYTASCPDGERPSESRHSARRPRGT